MRRWVMGVVAVAMAAACSDGTSSPTASGSATGMPTGTIRFQASGGEGEINAVRELVKAFEAAYPGTTVNLDPVASAGDHVAKLTTGFAAKNPPDLFLINYRRMGAFVRGGAIAPAQTLDTSAYYPQAFEAFSSGGTLLCLPQNMSSMVVYYNPSLFARAGVAVPKDGWTSADMLAAAQGLAAKGIKSIGFETALIRVAPFAWSAGGEIVDNPTAPTKVTLGNAGARKALQFMLDLQKTGLNATDRAAQSPEEQFSAGKAAMLLESRRAVPGLRSTEGLDFDVAPVPKDLTATSVLHSDGYCVSKEAKNAALAHAFARFAVGPDGSRVLAEAGRIVPSLKAVAESPAYLAPDKKPKRSQIFIDAIPTLRAMPSVPGWNEAEEAVEGLLEQLFAGRLGLDETISRIETETARVLK